MNYKRYWTGLVITERGTRLRPQVRFRGSAWRTEVRVHKLSKRDFDKQREVVIYARSWLSAQRALELIWGCHQVIQGAPTPLSSDLHLIAHNKREPEGIDPEMRALFERSMVSTPDIPFACAIAAKASRRQRWVYAVAKYQFSVELFSVHHVDLEPHTSPYLKAARLPSDHILLCHAIISAYSVIEDLGLNVPASSSRPSRINNQWNPEVKADLERRLDDAGIDRSETLLWTTRGPRRKIERKRPVPLVGRAPWYWGPVRDCHVEMVDAIAYAEWLRDRVASHNVKDLTRVLSPYDVTNVQHVARRLLLESLGFWRAKKRSSR